MEKLSIGEVIILCKAWIFYVQLKLGRMACSSYIGYIHFFYKKQLRNGRLNFLKLNPIQTRGGHKVPPLVNFSTQLLEFFYDNQIFFVTFSFYLGYNLSCQFQKFWHMFRGSTHNFKLSARQNKYLFSHNFWTTCFIITKQTSLISSWERLSFDV